MPTAIPTIKIGGITCQIRCRDGTIDECIVEDVPGTEPPTATVVITCPWAQRYDVMLGLAGGVKGTAAHPVRVLPFLYPDSPNLRCIAIRNVRPIGPMTLRALDGWPTFTLAEMTVVFGVFPWQFEGTGPDQQGDPSGQPWTTVTIRATSDTVVPEGVLYKWNSGPDATKAIRGATVGFIRPKHEISIKRHWMPAVPVQYMATYASTLNAGTVALGDLTYPRGYLMFASMNETVTADTLGNRTFEVEYVILAQTDADWNSFLARDGVYRGVDTNGNGTGVTPYQYADWYDNMP